MIKKVIFCILIITSLVYADSLKNIAINPVDKNLQLLEGFKSNILLEVLNPTKETISSDDSFFVSYHLYDSNGTLLKWDNIRTHINIKPNSKQNINLTIEPLKTGAYIIRPDIVKEGEYWIELKSDYNISVQNYFDEYKKCEESSDKTCWYIEGEDDINRLNLIIQRTLKASEKHLDSIYVKGFAAGDGYSEQIWARDSYTALLSSQYYYKDPFLSSWINYFLSHKQSDGLIYDWFSGDGKFDKNTVETDQESSLALAYFELLDINKSKYISKIVDIEAVLENVIKHKQDTKTGLITNGHTIDWGDVQYGFESWHDSVKLNDKSYIVVGIYTNALFYKAVSRLTAVYKELDKKKFHKWNKIKTKLHENINKYLWNETQGYYRLHKHITPLEHPFDEDMMFGLGGNATALSTDLVDEKKAKSIINTAVDRQKFYNMSTISGVLTPPYPKNYFKHEAVNDYFRYQNGGQWDWFGGRFVYEMFRHGFEKEALERLREIAEKNSKNKGIYEWDTIIIGEARGSSNYAGAAGVMGNAVIKGVFGVDISNNEATIKEPIVNDKFILNLEIPESNRKLIYQYDGKCINIDTNLKIRYLGKIPLCEVNK